MFPNPIYYELGDVETDGHVHLFSMNGQNTKTTTTKDHTHSISVVGDEVFCSTSDSIDGLHKHDTVTMMGHYL